jgi:hypothetical protein
MNVKRTQFGLRLPTHLCFLNPQIADAPTRSIPGALAKCPREVPAVRPANLDDSTSVIASESFERV